MINLYNFDLKEIENIVLNLKEKKFRSKQIYDWMYKNVDSIDDMLNISKDLRGKLKKEYVLDRPKIIDVEYSKDTDTKKYLMQLTDGNIIESVLMKYDYGYSVCISTQVGCRMNCSFCASGKRGLIRNLDVSEMIGQILSIEKKENIRIGNVVLMGIGEPLDNFENTIKFIKTINSEYSLNIGMRRITISTCGIVPKIYKLAEMKMQINLALSLHSIEDKKRQEIMPIANKYTIKETIDAMNYYKKITNRRITYEYALIDGFNSGLEEANKLANLIGNNLTHVNLIPINQINGENYSPLSYNRVILFKDILIKNSIDVTIRRKLGEDIKAACGQLRIKKMDKL